MLYLVFPATSLQFTNVQGTDGLHAIQTSGSGSTIVQYTTQNQDGQQFYVPRKCLLNLELLYLILFGHFFNLKSNFFSLNALFIFGSFLK